MSYLPSETKIVFLKSFRRLKNKTQLYSPSKGDHYHTRLTHTAEVCAIAENIVEKLRPKLLKNGISLDISLVRAIALGHDLGHTPFGHVGERTLSKILDGTDNLDGILNIPLEIRRCFKHNINSYRILSKYVRKKDKCIFEWQVLDGVFETHESI